MQKSLLPDQFLEHLKVLLPKELSFKTALEGFISERPATIRVNALKPPSEELKIKLQKQNIEIIPAPSDFPDCFIVTRGDKKALTYLPEYENGDFYIMNLSSVKAALALKPEPGEKVLDLCAAPGGKTIILAQQMQNTGEIVACDASRDRIGKLKNLLQIYGVENTKVICADGRSLWQKYPEYFDKVLLDAPCSMEGRFSESDPKTFAGWSFKKCKSLSKLQRYLLYSAISSTKPGGEIVYSTCTLNTFENETVFDWILKKTKGKVTLESFERIFPSQLMGGFTIAKFKKT